MLPFKAKPVYAAAAATGLILVSEIAGNTGDALFSLASLWLWVLVTSTSIASSAVFSLAGLLAGLLTSLVSVSSEFTLMLSPLFGGAQAG